MAWLQLLVASTLEIAWAIGLKHTEGFTRLIPSVLVVTAEVLATLYPGQRPADIGGHHIFDVSGPDIELLETREGPACHTVGLEQVNLASGERWAWQELE